MWFQVCGTREYLHNQLKGECALCVWGRLHRVRTSSKRWYCFYIGAKQEEGAGPDNLSIMFSCMYSEARVCPLYDICVLHEFRARQDPSALGPWTLAEGGAAGDEVSREVASLDERL
jgi:hypothetical protein